MIAEPMVTVKPCSCAESAASLSLILNKGKTEFQRLREKGFNLSCYCHSHNLIVLIDDTEETVEQTVRTLMHEHLHYLLKKFFGSEISNTLDNMRRRHPDLASQIWMILLHRNPKRAFFRYICIFMSQCLGWHLLFIPSWHLIYTKIFRRNDIRSNEFNTETIPLYILIFLQWRKVTNLSWIALELNQTMLIFSAENVTELLHHIYTEKF